jgi:hypothetical protein
MCRNAITERSQNIVFEGKKYHRTVTGPLQQHGLAAPKKFDLALPLPLPFSPIFILFSVS